ncbi:YfjI family protein [Phytomonospora sp. NPDC050363]|uniref:YfjI family protein n=1 Tax=Phytomonospora sp. NPDC050363 TaxID=3155642 RepID=UPI0033FB4FA8
MTEYDWTGIPTTTEPPSAAAGWDIPVPLSGPPPCPPLPTTGFPEWVRDMIAAAAHFTQTDPTMATTVALSALSACAAGRVEVEAKPGWVEPVCLFTAAVAAPGERKTPVHGMFTRPLVAAERMLAERIAPLAAEAAAMREIAERAAEKAKSDAARADSDRRDQLTAEAVSAALSAAEIAVPVEPRLLTDDATPEALTGLMAANGGRLAVISDEGGIVDVISGRYSAAPNLDPYLKGHAGSPMRVDRRGRDTEYIDKPALTVGVMIQPSVLRALGGNADLTGKGLVARFVITMPASYAGWRDPEAAPVPEAVADTYTRRMTALAMHFAEQSDAVTLTLAPDAQAVRAEWAQQVEVRLRPGGDLRETPEWSAKLVGLTLRLAALLHTARHLTHAGDHPISAETMTASVELGDTLALHYRAAMHTAASDPATGTLAYVLGVLTDKDMNTFTRRELQRRVQAKLPTAAVVTEALNDLAALGWVRPVQGTTYELHPQAAELRKSNDTVTNALESAFSAGQRPLGSVIDTNDTPMTAVTNGAR